MSEKKRAHAAMAMMHSFALGIWVHNARWNGVDALSAALCLIFLSRAVKHFIATKEDIK